MPTSHTSNVSQKPSADAAINNSPENNSLEQPFLLPAEHATTDFRRSQAYLESESPIQHRESNSPLNTDNETSESLPDDNNTGSANFVRSEKTNEEKEKEKALLEKSEKEDDFDAMKDYEDLIKDAENTLNEATKPNSTTSKEKILNAINLLTFGLLCGGQYAIPSLAGGKKVLGYGLGVPGAIASGLTNIFQSPQVTKRLFEYNPTLWISTAIMMPLAGGYAALPFVAALLQSTGVIGDTETPSKTLNSILGNTAFILGGTTYTLGLTTQLSTLVSYYQWFKNKDKSHLYLLMKNYLDSQARTIDELNAFSPDDIDGFFEQQKKPKNIISAILALAIGTNFALSIAPEIKTALADADQYDIKAMKILIKAMRDQVASDTGSNIVSVLTIGLLCATFAHDGLNAIVRDMLKLFGSKSLSLAKYTTEEINQLKALISELKNDPHEEYKTLAAKISELSVQTSQHKNTEFNIPETEMLEAFFKQKVYIANKANEILKTLGTDETLNPRELEQHKLASLLSFAKEMQNSETPYIQQLGDKLNKISILSKEQTNTLKEFLEKKLSDGKIAADLHSKLAVSPGYITNITTGISYILFIGLTCLTGMFQAKESGANTINLMLSTLCVAIVNWCGSRQFIHEDAKAWLMDKMIPFIKEKLAYISSTSSEIATKEDDTNNNETTSEIQVGKAHVQTHYDEEKEARAAALERLRIAKDTYEDSLKNAGASDAAAQNNTNSEPSNNTHTAETQTEEKNESNVTHEAAINTEAPKKNTANDNKEDQSCPVGSVNPFGLFTAFSQTATTVASAFGMSKGQ